jgi:hypothetical protein
MNACGSHCLRVNKIFGFVDEKRLDVVDLSIFNPKPRS